MHPLEMRLRDTLPTTSSRYYLSHNGERALGPFPMREVKWMIRCRHFSREVLIRTEGEPTWTSYRYHVSRSIVGTVLCRIINQLDRAGVLSAVERALRHRA